jgi:hypothetical protein
VTVTRFSIQPTISINTSILQNLALLDKKGRLAHAYLFVGPKESGKTATALALAKFLNCENPNGGAAEGCGVCAPCVKMNSGNYPDVHLIEADETGTIKIEQVRGLLDQIQLRPLLADRKIFIIRNVELFTLEGANALLKTLEEPSANSLLILTTSVLEKNLDTVRSRCHLVMFPQPANHFFSKEAQARKEEMIDGFVFAHYVEPLLKKIVADKDQTRILLEILMSWVRDAVLLKAGVEDSRLIYRDRLHELRRFAAPFSFEQLNDLKGEIVQAFHLLTENLNMKIPLLIIWEKLRKV